MPAAPAKDEMRTLEVGPDDVVELTPRGPASHETRDLSPKEMKALLATFPKRAVHIPKDPLNDPPGKPAYEIVTYMGHHIPIEKGKSVEVPAPLADILDNTFTELRTAQAQNNAVYVLDISDTDGPELKVAH